MITCSELGEAKWGRLGNQLFIIASTIGIASANKQHATFPNWSYKKYFKNTLPEGYLHSSNICNYNNNVYESKNLKEGDWDLRGFFQNEQFFSDSADIVRFQFEPSDSVSRYIDYKYGKLLSENTCSIHVRRGDYIKLRWDFPVQKIEYYQFAMSHFSKDTSFLVFSDDMEWCRKHFIGDKFNFIDGEEDIIDLFIMSRCKNHIIANSTFSWWGAWLNSNEKKIVLAPVRWCGPGVTSFPLRYTQTILAKGYIPLMMPGESKNKIVLEYMLLHPVYLLKSKIQKIIDALYKRKVIQFVVKKIKL